MVITCYNCYNIIHPKPYSNCQDYILLPALGTGILYGATNAVVGHPMDTVKAAFRGVTSEGFRVVAIRGVWDFGFRAGGGFTFWGNWCSRD